MDRPRFEVADVFRCYGTDYRQEHGASMSMAQHRVMSAIEVCRTAALGGHLERCDQCGHQRNAYKSCADRHCTKCQSLARAHWIQDRQAELLNTEYFHVVFTCSWNTWSKLLMPANWSFSPRCNHSGISTHSRVTWLPPARPNGWSAPSGLSPGPSRCWTTSGAILIGWRSPIIVCWTSRRAR
jgi:Transposase zinc-binding domain